MSSTAAGPGLRTGIRRRAILFGYAATIAVFLWAFARFYQPESGFSYLIEFGAKQGLPQVSELAQLNHSLQADGYGYDAQYYVQLAMHPTLRDPQLTHAIDSLPYRARRILFSWTAYLFGLGQPAWILQAYAVQNAIAWLLLAGVLLHWFPPVSWGNLLRWAGVLFSGGMCTSVRNALIDGPSLLLIALGVLCVEKNRRWLATALFGIAALGRETNALGAASLVDTRERTRPALVRLLFQACLVAAPLGLWLAYIHLSVGRSVDAGSGNFDLPFAAYFWKWSDTLAALSQEGLASEPARLSALLLVAVTVQALFLLLRPSIRQPWWRAGVCYLALMIVLGVATWEGHPGATGRLLLPMQLAFNVLVPRTRRWLAVLVLGNITVVGAPMMLTPPTGDAYLVSRAPGLDSDDTQVRVAFDRQWFNPEARNDRSWRWARGTASFSIVNRESHPIRAQVSFFVDTIEARHVSVSYAANERWSGLAEGEMSEPVVLSSLVLQPGANVVTFATRQPASQAADWDERAVAFSLRNLEIRLIEIAR